MDWPGHGDSDPVEATVEPSAPLFADVLEDVIDALGLSRAVLIGNSVGGFAAARLAISRPECVAGLVLVNTGGFVPLNALSRSFCRVLGTPAVFRRTAPLFIRGYMKAKTEGDRRSSSARPPWRKPPRASVSEQDCGEASPHPHYDLRSRATDLSVPTLIVSRGAVSSPRR